MEMVNGYVFLDLTKSNVYAKALKVLGADKPVVIKDGSNAPYFVDSLTLDGTNVVITKGGKTITIANDNTITNVGDIQEKLIILDLSDYDLTYDIQSFDDISDANEITEEIFTNLLNIVKKAQNENKPLYYKTNGLYDSQNMKGLFVASNYEFSEELYVIIPFVDIADNQLLYVTIGKASDNKYYVFAGTNWIR